MCGSLGKSYPATKALTLPAIHIPIVQVEFVSFVDDEYDSFDMDSDGNLSPTSVPSDPVSQNQRESEDEEREEPQKIANRGAETGYGDEN